MQESKDADAHAVDASLVRSEASRALLQAWEAWRGDELLPSRDDVDLADIVAVMPYLSVLEVRSPEVCTIRLVGSALAALTGVEMTGRNYIDLAPPENRALRGNRMWRAAEQPCASVSRNRLPSPQGQENWLEFLGLPVRPAGGEGPLQFFAVASLVGEGMMLAGDIDAQIAQLADRYIYLDIGAGVPVDPILELGPRQDGR